MDMTASAALMTALAASSRAALTPAVTELSFVCTDGVKMAAQRWWLPDPQLSSEMTPSPHHSSQPSTIASEKIDVMNGDIRLSASPSIPPSTKRRRILCLHGWMDNCRSFYKLAPSLVLPGVDGNGNDDNTSNNSSSKVLTEVVALDLPGHGLSSHKSIDGPPMMLGEAAYYVHEAVTKLEWDSFALIGHSMGSAVGLLYAAAFPERVDRLVLLEGAGPLDRKARDVAKHVRAHVERRQLGNQQLFSNGSGANKEPRIYPSLEKAVETRCKTAESFPGKQWLSSAAAQEMVMRAVTFTDDKSGAVQFRHDPRLQWPSLQYYTWEQVEAMYRDLQAPTCILLAEHGWPLEKDKLERSKQLIQPNVFQVLPGSHHFHADPDTADAVIASIKSFLQHYY